MMTTGEIEMQVRTKAEEDPAFRAMLLEDPRAAVKEVTGLTVPEAFNLHVHEESATDFHMVLPPVGGRLSDEELRASAGGWMSDWW